MRAFLALLISLCCGSGEGARPRAPPDVAAAWVDRYGTVYAALPLHPPLPLPLPVLHVLSAARPPLPPPPPPPPAAPSPPPPRPQAPAYYESASAASEPRYRYPDSLGYFTDESSYSSAEVSAPDAYSWPRPRPGPRPRPLPQYSLAARPRRRPPALPAPPAPPPHARAPPRERAPTTTDTPFILRIHKYRIVKDR